MKAYLTFDVGTTAVKICLFSQELQLLALSNEEYQLETGTEGRVELDAERYWQAICTGTRCVLAESQIHPHDIRAICVTTQGETLIPIGENGTPLRKAIVWLDERASHQAANLASRCDLAHFYQETGLPEINGFLPLAKLMWLREQEPHVYENTKKFLLLEDYLLYRLTGTFVTEKSLACSTGWFSLKTDDYWHEILELAGVDIEKLPRLVKPGTALSSPILPQVQVELGLSPQTIVVTGAMDQAAGALGAGNLLPGCVTETTGTALAIGATLEQPNFDAPSRVTIYRHVRQGLYLMMPFCMTAGMFLKWFKDCFCQEEIQLARQQKRSVYDVLDELAAQAPVGSGGLVALPYLTGKLQPQNNPNARGVFFGVGLDSGKPQFIRAIYEAIAFMLRENLELLERVNKYPISQLRSLGGGAKSDLWRQIKADITGIPVGKPAQTESTSLGAAMLAAAGCGDVPSLDALLSQIDQQITWQSPSPCHVYEERYQTFCALYDSIEQLF